MVVYCADVAIDMPDSFPCDQLTRLRALARDLLTPPRPPAWVEFGSASNLIAWRFRGFVEWANKASAASRVTHEDAYRQEQMLFLAVSSAVSSIEATGYATHALASDPQVLGVPFGVKEQQACTPKRVRDMLDSKSKDSAVVQPWKALSAAPEWKLIRDLRIRMFHRSNLPAIVTGSIGGPPAAAGPTQFAQTSSTRAIRIDDVAALEQPWLADTVRSLLDSAIALVTSALPAASTDPVQT